MSYSLVLDEPAHNDQVEEFEGIKFIVADSLYKISQGFRIKSEKRRGQIYLSITPNLNAPGAGDCNTCSSCG